MAGGTLTNNGPLDVSGLFGLYGGTLAGAAADTLAGEAARRAADDVAGRPAVEALLPASEPPPTLRLSGYGVQTPLLEVVRRALLRQPPPATERAAHAPPPPPATPRHRVLLTAAADGERDELLGLLSGSDVARFLERRLPPEALAAPLADLRLPPRRAPPRRASLAKPALDALRVLLQGEGVAALLATDEHEEASAAVTEDAAQPLAACFSHSYLRALGPHDFGLLALPLGAFI